MKTIRLVGNILYWASFFLLLISATWLYQGVSMAWAFFIMAVMLGIAGFALRSSSPNPNQFSAMKFWTMTREFEKERKQ